MKNENLVVRSQLIPLHNIRLVLPNTAIAEVISFLKPEPIEDSPAWLLGKMEWRGVYIPLISFETASTDQAPEINRRSRVIVLNALGGHSDLPFYAVVAQGIPRLMGLDMSNILDAPNPDSEQRLVLRHVVVEGHPALIPDQKALEEELSRLGIRVEQIY